jgi:delta24-sterol reductase
LNNITIRENHQKEIKQLQEQITNFFMQRRFQNNPLPLTLKYHSSDSYTIRTKSYKKGCHTLDCGALNHIIEIDPKKQTVIVEPRVTMNELLNATIPYGLTVPVIPELKEITVGGAIMGMGAESASHKWGTFNDACTSFQIIIGDGTLLKVSPFENSDIFYGIPGSYGSLGTLVAAEIKLIPAKDFVHLRYHIFSKPIEAVQALGTLSRSSRPPDFLDGIIFEKNLAVVIEGNLESKENISQNLPKFSQNPIYSKMYFQHVNEIAFKHSSQPYEELMTHQDYFFRYDQGAFWMGAYVFQLPLMFRFIMQAILKISKPTQEWLNEAEIQNFHKIPNPNIFLRTLLHPFMRGKKLCKFLHKAEKWVQNRSIIQDFGIPEKNASSFLTDVLDDPGIFPIWLLPIKGTNSPQIFAPHLLSGTERESYFINFGLYGIPSYSCSIEEITKKLEQKTQLHEGRKALYSRSYYNQDEFWSIYSHEAYDALRNKTFAEGVWHEITDKVLSV